MIKTLLCLAIFLFTHLTYSQHFKYYGCECLSYYDIQYRESIDSIFNPYLIKKNRINRVSTFKGNEESNYNTEIIVLFDTNGYIKNTIKFLEEEREVETIIRDKNHKITRVILTDSFSIENHRKPFVYIYKYDSLGRLERINEIAPEINVFSDSLSNYIIYSYDTDDRVLSKIGFHNYNESFKNYMFMHKMNYHYNDSNFIKTVNNQTIICNKNWKPKIEYRYIDEPKRLVYKNFYEYDYKGRLSKFSTQSGPGQGRRCEDEGNYSTYYNYSTNGLLKQVISKFKKVECPINFNYSTY